MNKKVYFAGSIRGGRVDAGLYNRINTYIQKTDVVLTEHVGVLNLKESRNDREIYDQDTAWLRESDLLICEATCPSCLCRGSRLQQIQGEPVRNADRGSYEKEEEIFPIIDSLLK